MIGFQVDGNKLIRKMNKETLCIQPWGKDALRVQATINPEIMENLPNALLGPSEIKPEINIVADKAQIINGKIKAEISKEGCIKFFRADSGNVLLEEVPPHLLNPAGRLYKPLSSDLFRIEARFNAYDDERIYGLGQHRHGYLNQKGCVIELAQHNCEIAIPFMISSRGYGFLWNNPAIGRVELGANGTRWVAEASRQIDYYITAGDSYSDITERYADATGHAPMMPQWATGFWQSKLRYRTQDELLSVAREYKRRGLPLSVIIIDFFHWTAMGNWKFDPEYWPDPSAMVRELDEMSVKLMVSIWPTVNRNSENYNEMNERGMLLGSERGIPVFIPFKDGTRLGTEYMHFYDPTNPEARKFIWDKVKDGYFKHGIKIWWLDAPEPEMYPFDPDNVRFHIGNGLEVGCLYPIMHQKAFYEGMKAEGEEEIITLNRSAWAGSQRYAAAVWSGDIVSTFESLQVQVRAGLNIGLSGIPWWNTDIGGFLYGKPAEPYFRELIVRWFQYGAFCPLFRIHGCREPFADTTGTVNEVWEFGERAYEIIKEYMFIRERLRPYIMEQMRIAHEKGTPPMRPLFFDFPGDELCVDVDDEFLFGPDILVAPVLFEGATSRPVYLPAGSYWTDVWTDQKIDGGQWIKVDAPLERIPLYLRDGKRVPIK